MPPPKRDAWGPGTRVPAIVISPFAKQGAVCHASYDTLSILKTIEERYALKPLCERDGARRAWPTVSRPKPARRSPWPIFSPTPTIRALGPDRGWNAAGRQNRRPPAGRLDGSGSFDRGRKKPRTVAVRRGKGRPYRGLPSRRSRPRRRRPDDHRSGRAVGRRRKLRFSHRRRSERRGFRRRRGRGEKARGTQQRDDHPDTGIHTESSPDQLFLRGPTAFDADVGSLRAILAEWARPNLTRRERLGTSPAKPRREHAPDIPKRQSSPRPAS